MIEIHEIEYKNIKQKLEELVTQSKEIINFNFKGASGDKCILITKRNRNIPVEYKIVKVGRVFNEGPLQNKLVDINDDWSYQNGQDVHNINAIVDKPDIPDAYSYLRSGWELFGQPFFGTNGYVYQAVVRF